jgi:hypothetical protein
MISTKNLEKTKNIGHITDKNTSTMCPTLYYAFDLAVFFYAKLRLRLKCAMRLK